MFDAAGVLVRNRRLSAIARERSISIHTVRNHLRAIFRRLGVHSQEGRLEAIGGLPPDHFEAPKQPKR